MEKVLEVRNLDVTFQDVHGRINAVNNLSFSLVKGEVLCLIGESGSGKSVTAKSIMRLNEKGNVKGEVLYCGKNIFDMDEKEFCKIRGNRISMIFQEPMTVLNPVVKIGKQIEEVFKIHKIGNKRENRKKIIQILESLKISDAEKILEKYPFELSGGLRQRIVIAIAVICEPDIIIADEPTTALDVTTQMETLMLLKNVAKKIGSAVLFITHDLGVVAECADRVIVMYGGRKMEECSVEKLFHNARHPYSKGLILSRPTNFDERYYTINGSVEINRGEPVGCPFYKRCAVSEEKCRISTPKEFAVDEGHKVACWLMK